MSIYYDSISEALGLRPIKELVPDYEENISIPEDSVSDVNGEFNPFYGFTHTEETKQILKQKRKRKNTMVDKNGKYIYGSVDMIDYKNIFPRQYNKVYVEDTHGNRFHVLKNDPRFETKEIHGLNKGKKGLANHLNQNTFVCVHCGLKSTKGNITRWHNDNCKRKP